MTVYVDDYLILATVGRTTSRWSHMMADTTEELEAFARKLRLNPSWVQYPGTHKEHYDLTEKVRLRAFQLGAVDLPTRSAEWVALSNRKRNKFGLPLIGHGLLEVPPKEPLPVNNPTLF